MLRGFRDFLLRGNVVDLAVAFVMGAAFTALVTGFVADFVTPLLGIPGKADFASLTFNVNGSLFRWGDFVNRVIAFVSIAAVIYFIIVVPMTRLAARRAGPAVATTRQCTECLSDIPVAARRCAFCTSPQTT